MRPRQTQPLMERVWSHVQKADGCWTWSAYTDKRGYGRIKVAKRTLFAHRVVYEHVREPIPKHLQVDHLCRNRGCVNPAHMELVTTRQNTLRGISPTAQNARRTHCLKGHPYDLFNTYLERGRRTCRICLRARVARTRMKRRAVK